MKIAIVSDSHDNLVNIERGLKMIEERGIANGMHLGDYCAPFAIELFAKSGIQWKGVWGNVDGDKLKCYQRVQPYGTMDLAEGDFREILVEGRTLFLTHYPEIARIAALSKKFDAVFHGHTHIAVQEMVENTLLANPGELCGARYGEPSFAIYDTETNSIENVSL